MVNAEWHISFLASTFIVLLSILVSEFVNLINFLCNSLYIVGKNIVKGATQMSGHSLKLHFCMFKISWVKHNSLDCRNFLEYFLLIKKITCSKFDKNKKYFCMFKALKSWKWTVICFSKPFFFYQMCTIPSENWRRFLNWWLEG